MSAKILVVDDEEDMLELVSFNLRLHGYEVLLASTGLDALTKARKFLPDLIILDLMLDGMDGYSICEILRAQPATATLPIIMLTALTGQIARLNGLAAGANEFLSKPFSPQRLILSVKQILELQSPCKKAVRALKF
jgi:DNA-binding response OmpR family regulator